MIYSSELAAKALRLKPAGSPHTDAACICAMCQRPLREGDLSVPLDLPRSFMDFAQKAPSNYLCGFCSVTSNQSIMRDLQRCVITAEGIYNLNTDSARAWFWMTPPKPPFAVVINHLDLAAFHYFWRTPVTLDVRLIQMNVDDVIYQVRRSRILKALEYAKVIIDRAPTLEKKKSVMKSPFVMLLRNPTKSKDRGGNGQLSKDTLLLAEMYPDCKEAADYLRSITAGERIALSPFLKKVPVEPVQPELITASIPKNTKEEV